MPAIGPHYFTPVFSIFIGVRTRKVPLIHLHGDSQKWLVRTPGQKGEVMGNLVISPWQLVVDKHRLDGGVLELIGGSWISYVELDQV